ncbi:MAG: DUF1992 domain-containing protein [Terriglobia bacterium]
MPFSRNSGRKVEGHGEGEFSNLSGKGKPLDLESYFSAPEDLRLGHSLLKNAGFVPEEIQLLKDIRQLENQYRSTTHETERTRIHGELEQRNYPLDISSLNVTCGGAVGPWK